MDHAKPTPPLVNARSSLDERVTASVPVAGYSSLVTRLERVQDIGDSEQNPADMLSILDYPHLTAMRAPRPTLLIHNAEDDCCFRAPLVKPLIYDGVRPFFQLYDKENVFQWYENRDPGTHNYQLDNREHAYRFFSQQFGCNQFSYLAEHSRPASRQQSTGHWGHS